jgi:L-asparagine transporter-like permease
VLTAVVEAIAPRDVLRSATAAVTEIRQQIDHQAKAADSVDTKASAVLTLTGTATGLVATRVHLDTDIRIVVGAVAFLTVLAILGCCAQAIRPRPGFSYGADAKALVSLVDGYSHVIVMVALADSLRDARANNVKHLAAKQSWYQNALYLVIAAVLAVAVMVAVEAIR